MVKNTAALGASWHKLGSGAVAVILGLSWVMSISDIYH